MLTGTGKLYPWQGLSQEPAHSRRQGGVLVYVRVNTDYDQTDSKGGCGKQSSLGRQWSRYRAGSPPHAIVYRDNLLL